MFATHVAMFSIVIIAGFGLPRGANAQHRASGPGQYRGYEPTELPEHWRGARGDLSHVVPDPTDASGVEAGATLIEIAHPGPQDVELQLRVGEKVRLSPIARRDRWRFITVQVENGVLWPVPGANRVFFARCPGTSFIHVERTVVSPPAQPTDNLAWQARERATMKVRVVSNGKQPTECRPEFDPPRKPNTGRLTLSDIGWGISMKVGEEFTLSDVTEWCRSPTTPDNSRWYEDYRFSDPAILRAVGIQSDGLRFTAVLKGITELSVPDPIEACQYNGSTPIDRFLIEVK